MDNQVASGPRWDELLNIGIGYVKEQQPAWIYVGVMVGMQILLWFTLGSRTMNAVFTIAVMLLGIYLSLMLSRHALTGEWGLSDKDHFSALRVFGMMVLIGVVIGTAGMLLMFLLAFVGGPVGAIVGLLAIVIATLWAVARFGFYLPALSVGHETAIMDAFQQSEPYWGRLMVVMVGPTIIVLAINYLLGLLIEGAVGALLATIMGGAVAAIGQAITIAAVAYLYANFVQSTRR